jgi:drug/metabolite transporter (DMT)-like permease
MKIKIPGQFHILGAAVLWSTSGLFIKFLDCHPVIIAGGRSLLAALFLLSVRLFFTQKKTGKAAVETPVLAGWRRVLGNKWIWSSGAAYSATMVTFVIANKLTASANAILLQYSAPIWAALLAWLLLKERPLLQHWIGLALASCGLILFFRGSLEAGSLPGDLLSILSGIVFGATSVFMRMTRSNDYGSPADSMILAHIMTALFMIPFLLISPPELDTPDILAFLFMGICQIGFASLLFSFGIVKVPAVSAMLIASIEPILNPVWVLLATGEKPASSALGGGVIIICAAIISSLRFSHKKDKR